MRQCIDGHGLAALDDSGLTSVAVCECGDSWLGSGEHRRAHAAYVHAVHAWRTSAETMTALGEPNTGRVAERPDLAYMEGRRIHVKQAAA